MLALLLPFTCLLTREPTTTRAPANHVVEFTFTALNSNPDPFNQIELDAEFTTPDGQRLRVPAFWAGGNAWRVRYASPTPGIHRFRTTCSDKTDAGLQGIEGSVQVTPYRGTNPLY